MLKWEGELMGKILFFKMVHWLKTACKRKPICLKRVAGGKIAGTGR